MATNRDRPDWDFIKNIRPDLKYLIIGGGSLGSALAGCLKRAFGKDADIAIIDNDTWTQRNRFNNIWPKSSGMKASSEQLQRRVEDFQGESMKPFVDCDVLITATDNIESRRLAMNMINPRICCLDMRAGEHGGEIAIGTTQFTSELLPDIAEEMTCGSKGSMGHTMTIAGLGFSRLLYELDEWATADEYTPRNLAFQLGFFGENPTLITHPSSEIRYFKSTESEVAQPVVTECTFFDSAGVTGE